MYFNVPEDSAYVEMKHVSSKLAKWTLRSLTLHRNFTIQSCVGFSQTDQQVSHAQYSHALYLVIKNKVRILVKIFISEKPSDYGKLNCFIVAYKLCICFKMICLQNKKHKTVYKKKILFVSSQTL